MHSKGLDIDISDEASSTVIHVRAPISARLCDVSCVFDKLGIDVRSCSKTPSASSCDMTLVVVDRHESQPLDDALKQSVTEGLQRVLNAHSQQGSPCSSGMQAGDAAEDTSSAGAAVSYRHNRQAAAVEAPDVLGTASGHPAVGIFGSNSSGRAAAAEVCRADSASESIPASKASSMHLSPSDAPASELASRQHSWLDVGGISLHGLPASSLLHPPAGAGGAGPNPTLVAAAGSSSRVQAGAEQQQQQPTVRFSTELSVCPALSPSAAGLQRTLSGRPLKPALKIDIPSDSDSRWNNDSSNTSDNPSSRQARHEGSCSSTISISVPVERPQQQRPQQQQQGGVPMHDLVSRLMQLGLERPSANDTGGSSSDDDDDAVKSISCRSGGSSNSAGAGLPAAPGEWKRLNSRSCGDLLLLASKQQMACVQRASDSGPAADASEGQLDCFGASYSSLDAAGMAAQEDSSRSLGSVDQDQGALGRRLVPPGAVSPAAVGAAAGSSGSGRRRRPLPRTPSRIILSPAAPDGSGESSGAPRLFVAIPKSGDERRSRRSSSVAATPRVPFTPASGMSILTPASARAGQGLKQLSSSLVGRKPGPLSPTAAAAAEAAANMPYNVAVAAAQLLSCGNSNAREAAAAVVAAAAEKGDSSTPLPSPLHVSAAAAAEQRFSDDGSIPMSPRVPRTSPCSFQHPPPTPVHPAVAAAAAAAIAAAAESAATSRVMAHLQLGSSDDEDDTMQLPACLSPERSPYRLSSSSGSPDHSAPMPSPKATSAPGQETIPEGSEEDAQASDAASSSSEEWWCQDMTGLTVRDIMTGPVKAVSADADMVQAKQLMMQHNLPGMLVDAGPGQAPGFLTRGDFFKANMMRRKGSRKRPHKPLVRDIMSPVLVVDATMTIESCAQALQEAGVHHAAVRDPAAADPSAETGRCSSQNGSISSMSAFVGLVSEDAIYCCLGLYPDYGAGEEELPEEGLLGLPHALRLHSGIDSSFDSSAGTETPLSSRSRVVTPLLDSMRGDVGQQQQERQASMSTDVGPSEQQSRQTSLVKLPDIVMLREGGGGQGSSAASSMCSVRSGVTTAADSRKSGAGDDGATTRAGSFALIAAASDSSNPALLDAPAAPAEGQVVPDALARYKHAAALWEVDMNDVEMIKRIGEGSFGEVMLATYRGTKVAVKRLRVLDLDDLRAPNEQYGADGSGNSSQSNGGSQPAMGASQAAFQQFFEREIAILASIRHPNVVNFIGACHKPGQRCLVTEYCARGSLDQVLHKSGQPLDLSKRLEFAMDIARGMACLHAQRPIIIHRDLKTANLLVSARFEIKVADFGLSRIKDASHLQVSRAGLEGTIEYCAPEVLRGEPYTERCDVYSFGVVLWELLLRQRPYSDAEVPVFLLMVNIGNGTLSLPEVPVESATAGLVELVNRCLAFSASDRPEFREVLTLLEGEYRALRARQPPRSQRNHHPPLPQHQQVHGAAGVPRCDSASSLAVHQQLPGVMGESPDPGSTPHTQSPAGTLGPTAHVSPALTPQDSYTYATPRVGEQDPYGWQQQPWQGTQQQQPPQQRHRLSQHDSGMQSQPGSAAPSFGFGVQPQGLLQPAGTPQLQQPYQVQFSQQQQVFSVPLPHLQFQPQQQVFIASGCNSPRQQTPQHFAVPLQQQQQYVLPQLRVMSAFPSGNMGPQQQQQYQYQGYQHHTPSGGTPVPPSGGTPVPPGGSTAVKPPRHKQQLSRARSMPVPHSVNWDEIDADEGDEEGSEAGEGYQEEGVQDVLLFAEDSYGAVSNCSMTGYSPCPSGQLCMLVEPTSSTYGSSSAAGMLPYQQPQQQVLLAPNGQQVAVAQVAPMQPVFIQQPGGQLQQAYIQQQPTFATLAPAPQQQQPLQQPVPLQQQAQRILQRSMGTPSPTPAALGRAGTPLSSSPSPAVNHLAVLAAVGAARAREGSASGAASPRAYTSSTFTSGSCAVHGHGHGHGHHSHHSRSSSQGCSQDLPPLHLLQLGEMHSSSRPGSPQRSTWTSLRADRHSSEGGGTAAGPSMLFGYSSIHHPVNQPLHHPQQPMNPPLGVRESLGPGVCGPAGMVTPLLLQRLDSLHRSGSSSCSPRNLHRSGSPGLHSGEQSGQLMGLLVPGFSPGPASGPNSPRSHSPRAPERHLHSQPAAVVAAAHHLNRPGSSRLAIQGSYELPPGAGLLGDATLVQGTSSNGGSAAPAMAPAGSSSGVCYGDSGQLLPTFGVSVVHAPAGHVYHHQYPQPHPAVLQPGNRRAPSLLRIDSNSRDRAVSPFAVASGASSAEQAGHVGPSAMGVGSAAGHVAAAPAGTFSRTLSPFAAASSAGSSLEDVASRGDGNDVVAAVPAAVTAAAAGTVLPGGGAVGCSSGRPPAPARYVSPFAAASTRQEDDGDTDAVFDTRPGGSSRSGSPAPPNGSKGALQGCSVPALASSSGRRLASPFALMQQQGGEQQ